LLGRVSGILCEANRNRFLSAARLNVSLTRTMTGFASKFFLGVLGTRKGFSHNRVLEVLSLIRVANDACITAGVFAVGLSHWWRDCACDPACADESEKEDNGHKCRR
jgi:hypothetical protein